MQVSEDRRKIKEIGKEQTKYYQMIDDRCRIERYLEIEYAGERNWRLTIGTFETNGPLSVESVFPIILSDNECDINMGLAP